MQESHSDGELSTTEKAHQEQYKIIEELKSSICDLQSQIKVQTENEQIHLQSSQTNDESHSQQTELEDNLPICKEVEELKEELENSKCKYEKTINDLESHNNDLKTKLRSMKNERDNAKSSLLELEIAKHECEEGLSKQDNEIKMKIAQLTTEKETLEVTLGLREQELKARKEELRDDKVKYTRNNRVQCYL